MWSTCSCKDVSWCVCACVQADIRCLSWLLSTSFIIKNPSTFLYPLSHLTGLPFILWDRELIGWIKLRTQDPTGSHVGSQARCWSIFLDGCRGLEPSSSHRALLHEPFPDSKSGFSKAQKLSDKLTTQQGEWVLNCLMANKGGWGPWLSVCPRFQPYHREGHSRDMAADTAEEPLLPQSEENTMAQPHNWHQRKTLATPPCASDKVASCSPHTRFSVEDWQLRTLNTKYAGNNTL